MPANKSFRLAGVKLKLAEIPHDFLLAVFPDLRSISKIKSKLQSNLICPSLFNLLRVVQ